MTEEASVNSRKIEVLRRQVEALSAQVKSLESDIQHIGKWIPALSGDTAKLLQIVLELRQGNSHKIQSLAAEILQNYETLNPPKGGDK